jgi:peptidylprolyl isomerase
VKTILAYRGAPEGKAADGWAQYSRTPGIASRGATGLLLSLLLLGGFHGNAAARTQATGHADAGWQNPEPGNLLVIDTNRGRIVIELYPRVAPQAVARIKTLVRQHFYDGLDFFRVVDGFMAQTGDPRNTGLGGSALPPVPAEFGFTPDKSGDFVGLAEGAGYHFGLTGIMPVAQPVSAKGSHAWGMFCAGVMGMARGGDPDSANSQFFIMRNTNHSLDRRYAPLGRVLSGLDVVRQLKTGEPVASPRDRVVTARLNADLPRGRRVRLQRLAVKSVTFERLAKEVIAKEGNAFDPCDVMPPVHQN